MTELWGLIPVFRHPVHLWAIVPSVLICAVLFGLVFMATRRAWKDNPFLRFHRLAAPVRAGTYARRCFWVSLVLALLIAVWAEPERRQIVSEPVYGGVRVTFKPDVSLSMLRAQDVPPFPNRLVAAKSIIAQFGVMTQNDPELKGSYKLAIIPFAGTAITYLPFSTSIDEFIEAVDAIDETTIGSPGTELLPPFLEYERMLNHPSSSKEPNTLDIVVLISDGGKGEGAHKDVLLINAARKRMKDVQFFTVGIGSVEKYLLPDGTEARRTIPVHLKIYDSTGAFVDYVRENPHDKKSKPMTSELDERTLKQVAGHDDSEVAAGGEAHYFFYEGREQLLAQLKAKIIKHRVLTSVTKHEHFTPVAEWFLVPALTIALFAFGYAQRLFFLLLWPFQGLWQRNSAHYV